MKKSSFLTKDRKPEKPLKNYLYFRKQNLFYILGNRDPKRLFIFHEVTFRAQKIKKPYLKNLIFLKITFSSHKPRKCLIFQKGTFLKAISLIFFLIFKVFKNKFVHSLS